MSAFRQFAVGAALALCAAAAIAAETVTYTYDTRGRIVRVDHAGTVNNGVLSCYGYDRADNRTRVDDSVGGSCPSAGVGFAVGDATATEAGTLTFTVKKVGSSASSLTVSYATANGTATAGTDYTAKSGVLTFAAADTSKTITVTTTNDTALERPETLLVSLTSPSGGALLLDDQAVGTIDDDEGFSINSPAAIVEGAANDITFTVSKTGSASGNTVVAYATSSGTATEGVDFPQNSGTLFFAAGDLTKTVRVQTTADTAIESNETFSVTLSNPSAGSVLGSPGTGTITDDDTPPSFSVIDKAGSEGNFLAFTVTKAGLANGSYSVSYSTSSGTATAGADFTSASGTLTFLANETTKTVNVHASQDVAVEGAETFNFVLSGATGGATISDATGVGTITDDDNSSSGAYFTINNVSVGEGGILVFTVTKTGSTSGSSSVSYATANGSAGSTDYTSTSGTLTFTSTQASRTVSVQTTQDGRNESNETLSLNLSGAVGANLMDATGTGTIVDDDDDPCPTCLQSQDSPPEAETIE